MRSRLNVWTPLSLHVDQPHWLDASGSEPWNPGRHEGLRTFYAFDVEDGSLVSQSQAQFPHRSFETGREHFLRLADKLFYVTAAEVTELSLEDIRSKKHGWH